jgi:hypothetical protein
MFNYAVWKEIAITFDISGDTETHTHGHSATDLELDDAAVSLNSLTNRAN